MGLQRIFATCLDAERAERLTEILREEPLLTRSAALALSVDILHRVWREAGRDMKTLITSGSKSVESARPAAAGKRRVA